MWARASSLGWRGNLRPGNPEGSGAGQSGHRVAILAVLGPAPHIIGFGQIPEQTQEVGERGCQWHDDPVGAHPPRIEGVSYPDLHLALTRRAQVR